MNARLYVLLLLTASLSIRCTAYQAYPGDRRPRSEVALLTVSWPGEVTLDGEVVPSERTGRIEVLPGWHTVAWEFEYPNGFREPRDLLFDAEPRRHYRVGQRFFAAPHPAGPIGEVFDLAVGTAFIPFRVFVPEPAATAPPAGAYYAWVVEGDTKRPVAGTAPDVAPEHPVISYVPLDE